MRTTSTGRCGGASTKRLLVGDIRPVEHSVHRLRSLGPQRMDRSPSHGPFPIVRVSGTAELTERHWQQIAPLLVPAPPRRGRPNGDLRRQLEGILAVMRSGAPWREAPSACGPWQTIYARYALWVRTGLWDRIAAILHPDLPQPEPAAPP